MLRGQPTGWGKSGGPGGGCGAVLGALVWALGGGRPAGTGGLRFLAAETT